MAPAHPMTCSAAGCDYSTPPDAPDFASRMQCLTLHVQAAHPQHHVPAVPEEARGQRPEARENMEEYEWQTFVSEWKEYKKERRLTGDGILDELWLTMSKRLSRHMAQSFNGKNETEILRSMKNHAVTVHPRIQSIDLLKSSPPDQFLATIQGRRIEGIPNTSFALTTTNDELLKEIQFFFLLFKFKGLDQSETDDTWHQIQTCEELVAHFQAKAKKKSKRPRSHSRQRSQSRGRSRSRSILKNRSENMAEGMYGEERGRKRMKGEESRMMTRSRSRAAGTKSVRIRSPSDERSEPESPVLPRETLFDKPSADIHQQGSKAKMHRSWICKHCGKEYLRKDFHGAHQEKCQTSTKKISLVKKTKKKRDVGIEQKDTGCIECFCCHKRLNSPSQYQHHLSTQHYADELMVYLKWPEDGRSYWSCKICDYSAPSKWPIINHVGSKHMLLKEVVPPEVWASIPPPYSQAKARGAQLQAQDLPSTSVEVPAPPSEASASAEEQPKAETSVAVSPVIKQEPVGWTARSGSAPISGDIRDVFNLTSDEESDDEMEPPILEPVIENLGSHTSTPDLASESPLLGRRCLTF